MTSQTTTHPFSLIAPYKPAGDQPQAIKKLTRGLAQDFKRQTLLGVTGSGKTMTMASVIEQTQKPALIISHNKTLAAQLSQEFREYFPHNSVSYFVSYYDYYQPEAYLPRTDTYIAKDANINDEIDRLRHATMEAILTRPDAIVVASVSCIYGLGRPTSYLNQRLHLEVNQPANRRDILAHLTRLQYQRNDTDLTRGAYRVRGDVIDIHPAGEESVLRIEIFGPKIDRLTYLDSLTGEVIKATNTALVFPAKFFLADSPQTKLAIDSIRHELDERILQLKKIGKEIEAQRLLQRTTYDLEMLQELGYVSGIENYSRHMDGRTSGEPPSTLLDYFHHAYGSDGFLTFIDESHITIPQIGGMHAGDKARKDTLIQYGFRLPSARDNRPLTFSEFEDRVNQVIFVSATPGDYELNTSHQIIEQIVRPTGLLDPDIEIKPTTHQIDDVISQIQTRIQNRQRVIVTTLTKRMAEELSAYLVEMGLKSAYIHGDIDTIERIDILRNLRLGTYDILIGINLLREGLDLPEVSLVAIMDADKEGYLRSAPSLIQVMGRAARHADGHVIMYADKITGSMRQAIKETDRRRQIQSAYNQTHHITPQSIIKAVGDSGFSAKSDQIHVPNTHDLPASEKRRVLKELTNKMELAARNLEFEQAATLRDTIRTLRLGS